MIIVCALDTVYLRYSAGQITDAVVFTSLWIMGISLLKDLYECGQSCTRFGVVVAWTSLHKYGTQGSGSQSRVREGGAAQHRLSTLSTRPINHRTHSMQKSPRIVPMADSEGLVAPSILRPSSTTFTPSHTMHTTGPDDCTYTSRVRHVLQRGGLTVRRTRSQANRAVLT